MNNALSTITKHKESIVMVSMTIMILTMVIMVMILGNIDMMMVISMHRLVEQLPIN